MSKNNEIIYTGLELTSDRTIRSKIITLDPYYVLADMLLKAKKPYGIKPNKNIVLRTTFSEISLGSLPLKNDMFMDIIMNTKYVDTEETYSVYGITTNYKEKIFNNTESTEYGEETSQFYQCPSYDASLKELKNKIKRWSNNNILMAKVLVFMAASSPEHIFWQYSSASKEMDENVYELRLGESTLGGWF